MSEIGHNSGVAADQLRSIVNRVENLTAERDEVNEQIKEVLSEAKGNGFDVKVLRIVLRRRKMKAHARAEMDEMVDLYETNISGGGD